MRTDSHRRRSPSRAIEPTLALLAALALAVMSSDARAVFFSCAIEPGGDRTSRVFDDDPAPVNVGGVWTYTFQICNTSDREGSPLLRDWELPWDPAAGIDIDSIVTPEGWAFSIETRSELDAMGNILVDNSDPSTGWDGIIDWQTPGNPMGTLGGRDWTTQTQVLHFYTSCGFASFASASAIAAAAGNPNQDVDCGRLAGNFLGSGSGIGDFVFAATAAPVAAPYQASWLILPPRSGDPFFPLGLAPVTPSFAPLIADVPEPGSLVLLGASITLIGGAMSLRRAV